MKAALLKDFKQMYITEMATPHPHRNEALIRMVYAGVCGSDITVYTGKHPTATVPVVIGHEIFGVIEEVVADGVTDLKPGDRVTVDPLISCGVCEACRKGFSHVCRSLKLLGIHENGGYAEYVTAPLDKIVKIPDSLSDKAAALAEPFAVGCHVVNRAGVKLGQDVLVIGAGPIGTVVALAAKAAGAGRVIVSEPNKARAAHAATFGFPVLDPAEGDIGEKIRALTDGNGFDVVIDASGSKAGVLLTVDACKIRGTIVPMGLSGAPQEFLLGKVSFKEITVVGSRVYPHYDFEAGVRLLAMLAETCDVERLVTDICSLDRAGDAIAAMMEGKNVGKILIRCGSQTEREC